MSTGTAGQSIPIDWKWTDYQAEVRDTLESSEYDLVVFRTGYGGGKSITGGQWIHRGALQLDHGESLVMGQDFQKARSTTFKVFFDTLPGEDTVPNDAEGDPENSPIVAGYNQNESRLTYITGHVVRLGGADKWNRFAGGEFHRIWCDEVAHYGTTDLYRLHEMLVTRQRTQAGPNTTLWTSTGNGFNQFYDVTERQVDKDGEKLPWRDRMKVIQASTRDNVLLPEDGLEKIVEQFKGTAREEQGLNGGFAAAEGLVYDDFSRPTHVVDPEEADRLVDNSNDWRMYGYDHGWGDPRVLIEYGKTSYDQYIALDLFYQSETVVEDAIGWLEDNEKPTGVIYCEHEPDHYQKFEDAGYPAEAANKSLDEGIPMVRRFLRVKNGQPGLLVSDRCHKLVQEFLSYKEEHVGKSMAEDHVLDASRYAIMGDQAPDEDDDGDAFLFTA